MEVVGTEKQKTLVVGECAMKGGDDTMLCT